MFEDFSFGDERIKSTAHEKVQVFDGGEVKFEHVRTWLEALSAAVEAKNVRHLIQSLQAMAPEYLPSEEIRSLLELGRQDICLSYRQKRSSLTLAASEEAA